MTTPPRRPARAPRSDPSHLVSGHATDTLSRAERARLYRAALDDQEIFDRLVEEESWRRLFSAPGVRRQLLEALDGPAPEQRPRGLRVWLGRFRTGPSLAVGAAAAAVLAVALIPRWLDPGPAGVAGTGDAAPGVATPGVATPGVATPGVATPPPDDLVAKSYGAPAGPPPAAPRDGTRSLRPKSIGAGVRTLSYTLELNRPDGPRRVPHDWAFGAGDQFRLRLGVDFDAWLYLFNRAAGDAVYTVLCPLTASERRPLPPSERAVVLPEGVWLTMDDTPEDEELVLVASNRPWPLPAGRETIPAGELEAAFEQAEAGLESRNWRRSEVGDRVELAVEESGELVVVLRLLGE